VSLLVVVAAVAVAGGAWAQANDGDAASGEAGAAEDARAADGATAAAEDAAALHDAKPCEDAGTARPAEAARLAESTPSEEAADPDALLRKSQNPLSDLVRINFQNNLNFASGPDRRLQDILNVQSSVRLWLGEDWLLINRGQLPLIDQPLPLDQSKVGFGDFLLTFFVSPRQLAGPFIWGVGPSVVLPTATDRALGAGKWGAGPSLGVLTRQGNWLLGALVIQTWSFAGDGDRPPTSNLILQPIATHTFARRWSVGVTPIVTANWKGARGEQWTVPVGPFIARLFDVGLTTIELSTGYYWNVIRPTDGPEVQLRLQLGVFLWR
jgi:hypothetical protein